VIHYTEQADDLEATGDSLAIRVAHAIRMGEGYAVIILQPTGLEVHSVLAPTPDESVYWRRLMRRWTKMMTARRLHHFQTGGGTGDVAFGHQEPEG
jgi:hypothetical protein